MGFLAQTVQETAPYSGALSTALIALYATMLGVASHVFVSTANRLSDRLHLHPVLAGLILLSIGTSLPEMILAFVLNYLPETNNVGSTLATGILAGTTVVEMGLALGLAGLFAYLVTSRPVSFQDISAYNVILAGLTAVGAIALMVVLFVRPNYDFDPFVGTCGEGFMFGCSRYPWQLGLGLLLAFFVAIAILYMPRRTPQELESSQDEAMDTNFVSPAVGISELWFVFFGTLLVIAIAAYFLSAEVGILAQQVNGNVSLSPEALYFVVIVVMATCCALPEIVVAIDGARLIRMELIVGALIGSTAFDVFFILPALAVSQKIAFPEANFYLMNEALAIPVIFIVLLTVLVFLFLFASRRLIFIYGVVLLVVYAIFASIMVYTTLGYAPDAYNALFG